MTTHRNLKPHYAEPKGKSGPVIVVKQGRDELDRHLENNHFGHFSDFCDECQRLVRERKP